jgi:hypothetical protein
MLPMLEQNLVASQLYLYQLSLSYAKKRRNKISGHTTCNRAMLLGRTDSTAQFSSNLNNIEHMLVYKVTSYTISVRSSSFT